MTDTHTTYQKSQKKVQTLLQTFALAILLKIHMLKEVEHEFSFSEKTMSSAR